MQDEVWKEAIRKYFEDFSKFFLADLDEYIDHTRGYAFLDSELQKFFINAIIKIQNEVKQKIFYEEIKKIGRG